jgi:hypothetical protein
MRPVVDMKIEPKRWSGSNNAHPLNDVMDGLNEVLDALHEPASDVEMMCEDELSRIARRVYIIATALGIQINDD